MTHIEALKQALAVLKAKDTCGSSIREAKEKAIAAAEQALAQPDYRAVKTYHDGKPVYVAQSEQEPVAGMVLVPYEPCFEMQEQGSTASDYDLSQSRAKRVYQAMIDMHHVLEDKDTSPSQPHQEQNLNCKSVQARLATAWGYVKVLDISDKRLMEMPPQRKPLSEDQLLGIWNKAITQDNGRGSHLSNQPFVHIARAVEAAHGIKGEA